MTDKQIINGIKYEKLTQDQLHDLSQWELVDIILAYRKDLKAKEQECEKAKKVVLQAVKDFSLEYGTPYYDRLLESAKALGIEVSDYA